MILHGRYTVVIFYMVLADVAKTLKYITVYFIDCIKSEFSVHVINHCLVEFYQI